jgi:hypothetical protein
MPAVKGQGKLQDHHSIDMPNAGRKRRLDSASQSDTSGVKSETDKPKPKRPRLQGKRRAPALGPKPDRDGCHGIKSEPPNDTLHYDFVNYSVTDLLNCICHAIALVLSQRLNI